MQSAAVTFTVSVTTKVRPGLIGPVLDTETWFAVQVTLPLGAVALVIVRPAPAVARSDWMLELPLGVSFLNVSGYCTPVAPPGPRPGR